MKKIISIGIVAIMLLAMLSCTAFAEDRTIYFVTALDGGPCLGPCQEGFEQACEELGYTAKWVCPVTACDTPQMVELCENALTAGADAIVCIALEDEPYSDVFTRAKEKGLAVVTVNTTISQDYTDAWIGTEPVGMGKTQAQALMNAFTPDQEINLVYMQSTITATTQNVQFDTVVSELEANGYTVNVKNGWHCESKTDSTLAADLITALRKANPEINAVCLVDGYAPAAIASYIEENNVDDLVVVSVDDSVECMNAVKNGVLTCTVIQDFRQMGYQSVYLCKDILDGNEFVYDNDSGAHILYAEDIDAHAAEIGVALD